ncbi:hypothetical protein GCM10027212_28380 [Actinotalea caeni]
MPGLNSGVQAIVHRHMHMQQVPVVVRVERPNPGTWACAMSVLPSLLRLLATVRLSAPGGADLVVTRGTPPHLEGCRSASRGLTLTLKTWDEGTSPGRGVSTSGTGSHRADGTSRESRECAGVRFGVGRFGAGAGSGRLAAVECGDGVRVHAPYPRPSRQPRRTQRTGGDGVSTTSDPAHP